MQRTTLTHNWRHGAFMWAITWSATELLFCSASLNSTLDCGRESHRFCAAIPTPYYLTGIGVLTLLIAAAILLLVVGRNAALGPLLLAMAALLLPASQVAVELMNCITTWLLPVQFLPKLDFSKGIPRDCATVVAVPALLLTEVQIRQLVEHLEVRFLGNRDRNLHFALLTDLPDSWEPASRRRSAGCPLRGVDRQPE